MLEKYPQQPYVVVADSYYSSLELAEELTERKLPCILSCRADRPTGLFSSYLHSRLQKKETNYVYNSKFSAISYFDKAKVNLITNYFRADIIKKINGFKLPIGIHQYRSLLGPLDHFDRQLHLYFPEIRNIKWTQALLNGVFKIAVNDTNVIAQEKGFTDSLRSTELQLIDHLTQNYTWKNPSGRPSHKLRTTGWGHFPKKQTETKRCVQCIKNGKKSNTTYICDICKVYLHPECMSEYHL